MVFIHVARVDTKPEFVRKFIAAASMLAGVAWIGFATAFPLIRFLTEDKEPFDWIFAVTMLPLMAIPGAIALFYGRRLFLRFDETSPSSARSKFPRSWKPDSPVGSPKGSVLNSTS